MNIILERIHWHRLRKTMRSVALGVVLAMAVNGLAHADAHPARGRSAPTDRDWRAHEGRNQREWSRPGYAPEPGLIYAPPVVYAPPQYEEPGINLVIPLNIR
jgi:hypothetical protein